MLTGGGFPNNDSLLHYSPYYEIEYYAVTLDDGAVVKKLKVFEFIKLQNVKLNCHEEANC